MSGYPDKITMPAKDPEVNQEFAVSVLTNLKDVLARETLQLEKRDCPPGNFFGVIGGRFYPRPEGEVPRRAIFRPKTLSIPGVSNSWTFNTILWGSRIILQFRKKSKNLVNIC